jgi:hypothetical protein
MEYIVLFSEETKSLWSQGPARQVFLIVFDLPRYSNVKIVSMLTQPAINRFR